jgi:hypothetical protein
MHDGSSQFPRSNKIYDFLTYFDAPVYMSKEHVKFMSGFINLKITLCKVNETKYQINFEDIRTQVLTLHVYLENPKF